MTESPLPSGLSRDAMLYWLAPAGVTVLALVLSGGLRARSSGVAWIMAGLVVIIAAAALVMVGWWRQRPIAPGDMSLYRRVVLIQSATAIIPALAGLAGQLTSGRLWVSIVGVAFSVAALLSIRVGQPSLDRHVKLWEDYGEMPEIDPSKPPPPGPPPWELLEPGHGHGLHD